MENNIPTPLPMPGVPNNIAKSEFKKSKIIIIASYIYIAISILPMLLSFSSRSFTNILFAVVPFVVIFTKNKKIYNITKILLILQLIIILIIPLFIFGIIASQFH